MANKGKEKLLSAEIDSELVERFVAQTEARGYLKKRALRAALEIYLSLPREVQGHILTNGCPEDFVNEALNYILNSEIHAIRAKLEQKLDSLRSQAPPVECEAAGVPDA